MRFRTQGFAESRPLQGASRDRRRPYPQPRQGSSRCPLPAPQPSGHFGEARATAQPCRPATVRGPIPETRARESRPRNERTQRASTILRALTGPIPGRLSRASAPTALISRGRPKSSTREPRAGASSGGIRPHPTSSDGISEAPSATGNSHAPGPGEPVLGASPKITARPHTTRPTARAASAWASSLPPVKRRGLPGPRLPGRRAGRAPRLLRALLQSPPKF